jgi:hypothetical protein
MTRVDLEWLAPNVGEFRVRQKSDARRNAVPVALMGGSQPFTLGNPRFMVTKVSALRGSRGLRPVRPGTGR